MTRRRAAIIAAIASFAVHLVPIFSLHGGFMPIAVLWAGFIQEAGEQTALFLAYAGAALVFQGLFGLVLYWLLLRLSWRRGFLAGLCLPLLFVAANWSFLYALPRLVLVEGDRVADLGELEAVCTLEGAGLLAVRSGAELAMERAGEAWVWLEGGAARGLLRMPDCALSEVRRARPSSSYAKAAPGGHLLLRGAEGRQLYFPPGGAEPREIPPPEGERFWDPSLTGDGQALVWYDRASKAEGGGHRLHLRSLDGGADRVIPLRLGSRDQLRLMSAVGRDGPFLLSRYPDEALAVDGEGALVWGPVRPEGVDRVGHGFRRLGEGWVGWDSYREQGRYRLLWDLPRGRGAFAVPRGRGIDSLAVDPAGRMIALYYESTLNLGEVSGAVVLLDTRDGREIYRRRTERYARIELAFLGLDYLAMTGRGGKGGRVTVYRVSGE